MRKVVYFFGGTIADFPIPDEVYAAWAERPVATGGPGEDLEKARRVLERVMKNAAMGQSPDLGDNEVVAACYIWHYLNTTDEDTRIDGDVIIVDHDGDGADIAYVPLADVELVEEE